jgi:AAA domain
VRAGSTGQWRAPGATGFAQFKCCEKTAAAGLGLQLPAGHGAILADGVIEALCELCVTVPAAFESDTCKLQRRQSSDAHRAAQDTAIAPLQLKAADQNIAFLRTPNGFGLAPMHDGKVVKPAVFAQLPAGMRSDIETRLALLQTELASVLAHAPERLREHQLALLALRNSQAQRAVDTAFETLVRRFESEDGVVQFLDAAKAKLVRNCDVFIRDAASPGCEPGPSSIACDPRFQPYLVTVMTPPRGRDSHAPIAEFGDAPASSFLHASGGYLLIEADRFEHAPAAFRALRQAMMSHKIPAERGLCHVPFQVNAVLLADEAAYHRLSKADPAFISLFKVTTRCAERIKRTPENEKAFANRIAELVARDKRMPLTAAAVSALIADGVSRAGSAVGSDAGDWLSLDEESLVGVLVEAHHGALQAEDKIIDAGHIQHVFAQRAARLPLPPDKTNSAV